MMNIGFKGSNRTRKSSSFSVTCKWLEANLARASSRRSMADLD